MTDERSLVDHALDIFVYAPVGLALEVKDLVPRLADRGRGQVALARFGGRMAADRGRHEMERFLGSDDEDSRAAKQASDGESEATTRTMIVDLDVIDRYDDLTAHEVLPQLERLSKIELDDVLRYEQHHRSRATVINRIRQLRT